MVKRIIIFTGLVVAYSHSFGDLNYKGINYACWERDGFLTGGSVINRIDSLGSNWVAVVITPYQDKYNSDSIYVDPVKTPSDSSICQAVSQAKAVGLSVMVRIQVDSKDGVWRGYFEPLNRSKWFGSYENIIRHYSLLSESLQVEMFGIGCEYKSLSGPEERAFWDDLIGKARDSYSGQITYCANWDEYQTVSFWNAVDIAGVDAYFPLTDAQHPSINELHHGWYYYSGIAGQHDWVNDLSRWQQSINKPAVLTEIGFRNVDYVAKEPWKIWEYVTRDDANQANAYEAALRMVSAERWCQGLFWWCYYTGSQGVDDIGWNPENKPAEDVLSYWFSGGYNQTPSGDIAGLRIYPNPASSYVNINKVPGTVRISIYNALGQGIKVLDKNDNSENVVWDLRNSDGRKCPSGLYLAVLQCFQEIRKTKLIIVK